MPGMGQEGRTAALSKVVKVGFSKRHVSKDVKEVREFAMWTSGRTA